MRGRSFACVAMSWAALGGGCGEAKSEPACVEAALACRATYDPPVFPSIYRGILVPNCAGVGGTCHTAKAEGGLDMSTEDLAFEGLVKRVDTRNVGCSNLVIRLDTDDPSYRMPYNSDPLSEANRCAIRKWVAAGAPR